MEPYVGQLCLFGFGYAPQGWTICDGSLLQINQYQALFSLLGTTYGGDGKTTFAVPDLRGRVPVGMGQGPGLKNIAQGERGGLEAVTITQGLMPAHTHGVSVTVALAASATGTSAEPSGLVPATVTATDSSGGTVITTTAYGSPDGTQLAGNAATASATCGAAGGGGSMDIRNPYVGMNWCIATMGIYPSRP